MQIISECESEYVRISYDDRISSIYGFTSRDTIYVANLLFDH